MPATDSRVDGGPPLPPARRAIQLVTGLIVVGLGLSGVIVARLGLDPWNVFHQGVSRHLGVPIGTVTIVGGLVVLLLWIPLRQRPGIGTLANALLIGATINLVLPHLHPGEGLVVRIALLLGGITLTGLGGGMYLGTALGPGPRDGLMTGLAERGLTLRLARTLVELSALALGWLLGGDIGIGTLAFALLVGPLVHLMVPLFSPSPTHVEVASLS